jgi:hypothetical protein
MNEKFLALITALVQESTRPYDADPTFAPRQARCQTEILQEIYRIRRYEPASKFLATVNCAGWPDELPHTLLARAGRIAAEWLPALIRQKQSLDAENEMTKFKRQRHDLDPFCDEDTALTSDAYSGQMPADDLHYRIDRRGYVVDK